MPALRILALGIATSLAACGGSGGGSSGPGANVGNGDDGGTGGGGVTGNGAPGTSPALIEGDITRYGVVTVADEAGEASDAIAAFNRVTPGVGARAFGSAADPAGAPCTVVPSASGGNDLLLVGYAPSARGARSSSIVAGDTVTLSSDAGTWTTLSADDAGAVAFYDGAVPDGAVPAMLQADVSAAADAEGFPAFAMAGLPQVAPLTGFGPSPAGAIDAGTTFGWDTDTDSGAQVRIVATTGFFGDQENGKRVSCLVPDTGSFAFPADVRAELGPDFQGELFLSSRVSIDTVQDGDTLLFLVRESFSAD